MKSYQVIQCKFIETVLVMNNKLINGFSQHLDKILEQICIWVILFWCEYEANIFVFGLNDSSIHRWRAVIISKVLWLRILQKTL